MPKILVAEDSPVQIELLRNALQDKGFEVLVAKDALQAGIAARRFTPHAIVLDINLPGGSGIEVLKRLKSAEKTSQIPVVVVTGNEKPETRREAMKMGAADFFVKPVDLEKLTTLLAELSAGKARSGASAT
jgi:DNA-binding response OmpR family regulator